MVMTIKVTTMPLLVPKSLQNLKKTTMTAKKAVKRTMLVIMTARKTVRKSMLVIMTAKRAVKRSQLVIMIVKRIVKRLMLAIQTAKRPMVTMTVKKVAKLTAIIKKKRPLNLTKMTKTTTAKNKKVLKRITAAHQRLKLRARRHLMKQVSSTWCFFDTITPNLIIRIGKTKR